MLLKIVGWAWLAFGVYFLLNPEKLRDKLKEKSIDVLKKAIVIISIIVGLLLIKGAWDLPGFFSKVVLVFGFLALGKGIYFLKAKGAQQAIEWCFNQPVKYLRMFAIGEIVIAAIILSA